MSSGYPDTQVTFLIGDDPGPSAITVHKEFACHASPVFAAAFNDDFPMEGKAKTYEMPDTTV